MALLSLFSLITILSLPSPSSQIKLSLTPISNSQSTHTQTLNNLASASIARANRIKHPHDNSSASISTIPMFPMSYGGYSVSLSFGSPAQKLMFVMDTGSSLVWFPCTRRYTCDGCDFGNKDVPKFIPRLSSSVKILGCSNKKCGWAFGSTDPVKCNGSSEMCPPYMIQYGSGSTSGLLLSETLNFREGVVKDFMVGCSIISARQPSGIVGFGRGLSSLPVQMGLRKFSYCLVSHRFDDEPVSSDLVLVRNSSEPEDTGDTGVTGISYTKFRENPVTSSSSFKEYYYLSLRKITVGGKTVKIPYGYLVPGSDGNGGTIIDSGSTFTYMDDHVHGLVAKEFENQVSQYPRVVNAENLSGLSPCFNVSGKPIELPELMFHFKGGAKLGLPAIDYVTLLGDTSVLCVTIVSSERIGSGQRLGPSIIIGNYQQQNIYVEYDLEKGRLGFKKQKCK